MANGVEVSLRELLKFDHVLPDSSFGISQLVRRVAKKEKAVVVPKAVSNNLQFLHRYASLNNMVVFMPVQAVYAAVKNLELAPVNLNCTPFAKRKLSIASRRQRALSPASRIFSEFAGDCFAAWQAHDEKALADACDHWWKTDVADPLNLI
ncbi:MAG: hypothetical protein KTR19_05895 [Hyphomicrobiales bacterium]|nr:hypothetical protein [Hyphomicrobiales bacterium]